MPKEQNQIPENLENKKLDAKKLLTELSEDISKSFWIKVETAEKLTKLKTESWLDWLKSEIESSDLSRKEKEKINNLWNKELERLFFTITWAKELIKSASENKLDVLKKEVDKKSYSPSKSWLETRLPSTILTRINNPKNIWDQLIWAFIWTLNSCLTTVEFLYNLWKWIIQSPYHIYLLVRSKAEIESLKKI